ncbi:hypothetical protein [Parvibacter caecicola]|uniref:hypothetical protein n=1 Tax=Parvibacter caecicola TaxID=747645 RepID=UPI0023F1A9B8|nr:hypothetical protein [Parvibacter caecicola]
MMGRLKGLLGAAAVKARQRGGQMTVELATVLPVALAIIAIVCNGMAFFSECAAFDRVARNAVRLYATVPAYGEAPAQAEENILHLLQQRFSAPNQTVAVMREDAGGYSKYTATLTFAPTLFGINLRQEVFGVQLPTVSHSASLTVDTYKPGMLL